MNTEHPDIDRLTAYFLGHLSSAEERSVRAHLSECPECRNKLSGMRKLQEAFQEEEPGNDQQEKSTAFRFFHSFWTRAAAIIIIAAGLGLGIRQLMNRGESIQINPPESQEVFDADTFVRADSCSRALPCSLSDRRE